MRDLIDFSQENEHLNPQEALQQLVESYQTWPQQPQQQQQQQPLQQQLPQHLNLPTHMMAGVPGVPPPGSGMRTPGIGGLQFASPAHANLALPMNNMASPHMRGSPAQQPQMQAPTQMVAQLSQQGHSSSATGSSSASPNVTNKRRRASAIKQEVTVEDGAAPETNGVAKAKVKPSPRIPKRQKGNNPG